MYYIVSNFKFSSFFSALQDAQDIFGLEFDLSELEPESDDLGEGDFDEDLDEEELVTKIEQRKARKKAMRKSIYQVRKSFLMLYLQILIPAIS